MEATICTPKCTIHIIVYIMDNDISFLLGLDAMDGNSLQLLNVHNILECLSEHWRAPVIRKNGHAYNVWDLTKAPITTASYYTNSELMRVHRHLAHPSAGKLYEILKRA